MGGDCCKSDVRRAAVVLARTGVTGVVFSFLLLLMELSALLVVLFNFGDNKTKR